MIWEILRIKCEYGISTWKQTFKLAKELLQEPLVFDKFRNIFLSSIYRS